MGFQLPADAEPGDAVLAHCPVCKELVYVLILPGSDEYFERVVEQMKTALETHVRQTGHDHAARAAAKRPEQESH